MQKKRVKKPTISEIKRNTEKNAPYFFDRKSMKFFGQTMSSFKVHVAKNGKIYIGAPSYSNDYRTGKRRRMSDTLRQYLPDGANSKLKSVPQSSWTEITRM